MSLAQVLHRIVSFVCMEEPGSESAPPVAAPPKIANLSDALVAYRRAGGKWLDQQSATREIEARAQGFDDWLQVAAGVPPASDIGQRARNELMSAATSFGQYREVYRFSEQSDAKSAALEKMAALATSLDEKLHVYELADADSEMRKVIFRELTSETRSCEEWTELFENADVASPLERFAAEKVIETTNTPEALAELVCNSRMADNLSLEAMMFAKLRGITASFDEWHDLVDSYSGEIETVGVEKMIETATTIDEILAVEEHVDEDNGTEEKLTLKAESSFTWTEEFCRKVIDEQDDDNVLFDIALKKLLGTAQTSVQCLQIYYEWDLSDENNDMILERLGELATANERAIIALVSESGSQIEEWAQVNA